MDEKHAIAGTGAATARRSVFVRYGKWLVVASLALAEGMFDMVIEPSLRATAGIEGILERYMPVAEILVLAPLVWLVLTHLERDQRRVAGEQQSLATLYRRAKVWQQQLEALHEASVAIAADSGYPGVLARIVSLATQLGHARYGALAEFDEHERVVRFTSYGMPPEWSGRATTPPTHQGLLRRLSGSDPVRLDDVTHDPLFTGFPGSHPAFRTFLGVPIRWQGILLGHLYVGSHDGEAPFTDDEERLLQMFAMEAAVAIHRARLEAEAKSDARKAERRTIAMELHDGALQALYGVGMQLDQARRQGRTALSDTVTVDIVVDAIKQAMGAIRDVLDAVAEEGEGDATERRPEPVALVADAARLYGIRLAWKGVDALAGLPPDGAEQLALCLCEAIANAARHGAASQVWIAARRTADGRLVIRVRDDGTGLPPQGLVEGHGLHHVRSRLSTIGGTLSVTAATPHGVLWRCLLGERAVPDGNQVSG